MPMQLALFDLDHTLLSGDSERFYETETECRRLAGAPPFGRYAAIIVSSEQAELAANTARRLGQTAPQIPDLHVYGPAPAPLAQLRGRHRHRLLVHAKRSVPLQEVIAAWLDKVDWPAAVRVAVDIDPYNFF